MTPSPQERRPLAIDPRGGAVGTIVSLSATGLPPNATLLVAFANLQSYQILQQVETDENGSFATTQGVPPWAELNGVHYFFASFSDERPVALSNGFHVTGEDGTVRLEGRLGSREEACVNLTDQADILYHLVGDLGDREQGDRVALVGTIAETGACGDGTGIVIQVSDSMLLPG